MSHSTSTLKSERALGRRRLRSDVISKTRNTWCSFTNRLNSRMIAERFPELAKLPIEEKRLLLNELCEDLSSPDAPDPDIVKILEERWKAFKDDPSGAVTLEEFRKRIGVS